MDETELSEMSNAVPVTSKQDRQEEGRTILPIGIYGWRKRFVYCFILLLVVMILVNLSLTIWILVVMHFNIVSHFHCDIGTCCYIYYSTTCLRAN